MPLNDKEIEVANRLEDSPVADDLGTPSHQTSTLLIAKMRGANMGRKKLGDGMLVFTPHDQTDMAIVLEVMADLKEYRA